ncbi:hypothetical protein [Halomontanus rarus]|uniref:hypothetical protein n=1 Tax=Halomontanus rarus TaxID=3034020 RepID=UPI0023E7C7BF|nr:hypothetical protein [Halovivax sp. TS33]
MSPKHLRVLVALVLVVLLAGCSAAGSIEMTAVGDDDDLATEASRPLPSDPDDEDRVLIRNAVENGAATTNDTRPPVDADGKPFAVDDRYYDLSVDSVDQHTEVTVSLEIDYNGTTDGSAVAYEDLSSADRSLVDQLLPSETDHRNDGYDMGVTQRYDDSEVESSVLLSGEYEALEYGGEQYPIRADSRDVTVTTYRYTAQEVASSSGEYADSIRDRYLFTLSGLSDAERDVVQEATSDRYYAESSNDDAFESVLNRFFEHDAVVRNEYRGEWIVRYEGEIYWAELDYEGF